ncbi:MAG: L-lactate dehydrogenase complex protein LldG [Actinomycetota bacterium]|nr:L-lactate dehydrogenase complex protein LldG [Actinomycetota bacterium]
MSATGSTDAAKEEILQRIRSALGSRPAAEPAPRDYRRAGAEAPGSSALLDLFEDRLVDYKATVHRTTSDHVGDTVRSVIATLLPQGGSVLAASALPDEWLPEVTRDTGFTARELDQFAGVVTACAAAAAQTGTIVLDGSPDQGRRAITLVPDLHVCVVRAEQVVETVPELLSRLDPTRPLTFISGPSATSDIELQRVEGVHGPRTLAVVLVTP